MVKTLLAATLSIAVAISTSSCIWISQRVEVSKIDPTNATTITSPVKAHLRDGSTVVYTGGVTVTANALLGQGVRYDAPQNRSEKVATIPLDSIVGMESFQTRVNGAQTAIVSTLATAGAVVAAVGLAVAIFGSCPTVYSDSSSVEEAELFSRSIAPLFEARDVDRLHAQPGSNGTLSLEVRNEAMETHYINHLQLLEASHAADEFVLPDSDGRVVAVRGVHAAESIVDRNGRDIRSIVHDADNNSYSSDRRTIDAVSADDMNDWIELTTSVPEGADKTTLVFRLRNSLLSTALFYDGMLGPAGARAINWLADDLTRISTAVELGRWYERRAGLHVSVQRGGTYHEVVRIPDPGPISWHDVAAVIPVLPGERSLRIRLSFVADYFRLDRVAIASAVRDAVSHLIEISEVTNSTGRAETDAKTNLLSPDDRYLQTNPGQRFYVRFNTGTPTAGQSRTFLLSSQGYYTEWIRASWIQQASTKKTFTPGDDSLIDALHRWSGIRESFEQEFRNSRVAVN